LPPQPANGQRQQQQSKQAQVEYDGIDRSQRGQEALQRREGRLIVNQCIDGIGQ